MTEPISSSVCRGASRNAARGAWAVRTARGEWICCPPRIVHGSVVHAAIASSVNQTVRLPRWDKLASYAGQFVSLCVCFGV